MSDLEVTESTAVKKAVESATALKSRGNATHFDNKSILADLDVVREGKKIVLPAEPTAMTATQAIKRLRKLEEDEEQLVTVDHTLDGVHYHDGLIALSKAIKSIYGWTEHRSIPTMFGPKPPNVVSIATSHNTLVRVLEGRMGIPNVEDSDCYIQTSAVNSGGFHTFRLVGAIKKKFEDQIANIVEVMLEIVRQESIYRGMAIRVKSDEDGDIEMTPSFMDITQAVTPIFSKKVEVEIATSIYTPIRHTEKVRQSGIPLKRGVLLEGPYGTGKTLTSYTTAQICVENGWTFVAVDRASGLRQALELARRYQPAVVFCEDIDRSTTGKRTIQLDDILNTVDGLESKSTEIMVVLTTNHVENISKAMLRPGRLDAVIRVEAPDPDAVERLIRVYGSGLVPLKEKLDVIGAKLAGQIPAVIREVVERSKLYAINLTNGAEELVVSQDALLAAAEPMAYHWGLMQEGGDKRSTADRMMDAVGAALNERLIGGGEGTDQESKGLLKEIASNLGEAWGESAEANTKSGKILEAIMDAMAGNKNLGNLLEKNNRMTREIHENVV
jgi:transitional endoplasmic reticulum ATPase